MLKCSLVSNVQAPVCLAWTRGDGSVDICPTRAGEALFSVSVECIRLHRRSFENGAHAGHVPLLPDPDQLQHGSGCGESCFPPLENLGGLAFCIACLFRMSIDDPRPCNQD